MKICQLLLFSLILVAIQCSCSANSDGIRAQEKRMLMTVIKDSSPVNYPPGKTITLRVFTNGEIEFDTYPDKVTYPFTPELKSGTITIAELDEIKSILTELESEGVRLQYGPYENHPVVDNYVTESLVYITKDGSQRTIEMKENNFAIDWHKIGSPALRKLMPLVFEISVAKRKET